MKIIALLCLGAAAPSSLAAENVPLPQVQAGDEWVYNELDGYNKRLRAVRRYEVAAKDEAGIRVRVTAGESDSDAAYTAEWNPLIAATAYGVAFKYSPAYPAYMFPLEVGKTWRIETTAIDPASGRKIPLKIHAKVVGRERIKVAAGEFDTLKIVREVYAADSEWWRSATRIRETEWYSPKVQRTVRQRWGSEYYDETRTEDPLVLGDRTELELVSYRIAAPVTSN
ncbi:MAG: hypothetical protein ACREV0_12185 [Burkholderiales bacterium]